MGIPVTEPILKEFNPTKENLEVLRVVLLRLRNVPQSGFISYEGGMEWSFTSTSLPQTTPSELNRLLDLAGIIPDEVKLAGECKDCKYSRDGRERGYKQPCLSCLRPSHINNFKPKEP